MKRLVASLACLAVLACSSGGGGSINKQKANIPEPEIAFIQLVGLDELNWPSGEIEIKYGLRINNRSNVPITLRQIELAPVSTEGGYSVYRERYPVNVLVEASSTKDFEFWAKAYSAGARYRIDAQAPISVRAVTHFESPAGSLRKLVVGHFSQSASGR
jgi:hypothetical protein